MPKMVVTNGDDLPIALSPETFARHDEAAGVVEGWRKNRPSRPNRDRFPGSAPGAWALLRSGDTITAGSGTTLGTGTADLCESDGTAYSPTVTVDVLNGGAEVTASGGDRIVRLAWTLGEWALSCPGAAS